MTTPRRAAPPRRHRLLVVAIVVVVVLAVALTALLVRRHNEQVRADEAAVARTAAALESWADDALMLVASPPIDLSDVVSPTDADGLASLRAECDRFATHVSRVAAATPPEVADPDVPSDFPGLARTQERRAGLTEALTGYQDRVAAAGSAAGGLCESYPRLLEVEQAQPGAIEALDALLADCSLSESGCVPVETDSWGAIADAVGPAYRDPAAQRAELFGAWAADDEDDPASAVLALLAQQSTDLVPLYDAYTDALRAGDRTGVEDARATLATTIADQQAGFEQAVRDANPGVEVTDPAATLAGMLVAPAARVDAEIAAAEDAFLAVVG